MKTYSVTVWVETAYGGFVPEQKIFRARDLESLYALLKGRGYRRYFIGSLMAEPV